jgi:hypothetical protein
MRNISNEKTVDPSVKWLTMLFPEDFENNTSECVKTLFRSQPQTSKSANNWFIDS